MGGGGGSSNTGGKGEFGMRPPAGFEAIKYPLRHQLQYKFGLSAKTETMNTTYVTLVRNYKSIVDPTTIQTNPHNAGFQLDAGSVCAPMSIIDNLSLSMKFVLTKHGANTNLLQAVKCSWTPVFFSFPEKLDAADDKTTTTVASILELLKDSTEEDVTPLFNNTKLPLSGSSESDLDQPLSTSSLVETFAIMNMDTDDVCEAVTFDSDVFHDALRYYTNKGALKACLGRTRNFMLSEHKSYQNFFIKKFVPRAIRRIVPYSYFGILIHLPVSANPDSMYYSQALTGLKPDIGVSVNCNYHEWNIDHDQTM